MKMVDHEPVVSVGLMTGAESLFFELKGAFVNSAGERLDGGSYRVGEFDYGYELVTEDGWQADLEYRLTPVEPSASFIVRGGNKIGSL